MASTLNLITDSVEVLYDDNENETLDKSFKEMKYKEKIQYIREAITIEPLMCFHQLASVVVRPAVIDLQYEMACRVNRGYNETLCNGIIAGENIDPRITDEILETINGMQSWSNPLATVLPIILLLILGTYSDHHKIRKPFIIIPVLAELFAVFSCILCIQFIDKWPVEVEGILQIIIPSFFGGPSLITMACFAYICDVSTPEMRVVRLAVLQICLTVWVPFGHAFNASVYPIIGSGATFILCFVLFFLALLYGAKVKEPRESKEYKDKKSLIKDIFNPRHVMGTFKVLTKAKGSQRVNIIFIMFVAFLASIYLEGEVFLFHGFVQTQYNWTSLDNTYYEAVSNVVNFIGLAVGVPLLSKLLQLNDLTIIIIYFADKIVANILFTSIQSTCGVYVSLVSGILVGIGLVAIRSQATKYVSEEDVGKTLSLLTIVSTISGIIGVQIYSNGIYKNTNEDYPYVYLYFTILLCLLILPVLLWKHISEKNQSPVDKTTSNDNGLELHNTKV